jgi:micrococcal nuclease
MQDHGTLQLIALVIVLIAFVVFRSRKRQVKSRSEIEIGGTYGVPLGHSTAKVVRVIDGDTVDVSTGGHTVRVRLDSIDCPENGQHWGDTAKFGLIKLIGGKAVDLECHGVDPFGRTLATIFVDQDNNAKRVNVNERMVALGHAWVMRRFYNHLPKNRRASLNRIESWAKSKSVGLWKFPDPIPPWKWRASNQNRLRRI